MDTAMRNLEQIQETEPDDGSSRRLGMLAMAELARVSTGTEARGVTSVIAVTWPFVARRAVATFARLHPHVTVRSAPATSTPGVPATMTVGAARWAVEQLERLVRYEAAGLIVAGPVPAEVSSALVELRASLTSNGAPHPSRRVGQGHVDGSPVDQIRKPVFERRKRSADRVFDQPIREPHVLREQGPVEVRADHRAADGTL